MVVGKTFAWGHLGKTAGDATLALFRHFPELIVSADGLDGTDSNTKHAWFKDRAEAIQGKSLILNVRRLPSWMLSFAQHRAKRGLFPKYEPLPMMTADEMADSNEADRMLNFYTDNGNYKIDRWFRTEFLKWDFLGFISGLIRVSPDRRQKVLQLGLVNAASYEHSVASWFNGAQLERLYRNNPEWATVERDVYRDEATLKELNASVNEFSGKAVALAAERDALREELAKLTKSSGTGGHAYQKPQSMQEQTSSSDQVRKVRQIVASTVPSDAGVLVVSRGDDALLKLDGRRASHFPQAEEGCYSGAHPGNSSEAINQLEMLRAKSNRYLLFPSTAFWWLEYYGEFRGHLESRYKQVWADSDCLIYDLSTES